MAKKGAAKKSSPRKPRAPSTHHRETEKLLVENFASLQRVLVNLSGKFDDLTRQISELLKLFEDSAKIIVKNEMDKKKEDKGDKQLLDTMISILDQNKVIAKGLTLMYESMNEGGTSNSAYSAPAPVNSPPVRPPEKRIIKKEEEPPFSPSRPSIPSQFRR